MKKAMFAENDKCLLCPHECKIPEGKRGVCGVRINKGGEIYSLSYGGPYTTSIDPIEKKPLYHFHPGKNIFSFGTLGCNFFCKGCQNWQLARGKPEEKNKDIVYTPKMIVDEAKDSGCKMIAYTYNEPTVFYEFIYETSKEARKCGLKNVLVSNGYINEIPLRKLSKFLDAANIDLKIYDEKTHLKYTGGKLKHVLNTIRVLKEEGVWVEITNLMIPGWNDDMAKFEDMCKWIKENVGEDTPLHISRFFPHYELMDVKPTSIETLKQAKKIAEKYLKYVYIGNIDEESNTYCPKCDALLIRRKGYNVENKIKNGECISCKRKISGIL